MNYQIDFTGKNAVITGAAGGIGFETAIAFLQNNCNVYLIDYNGDALREKCFNLAMSFPNRNIFVITADLTDKEDVERAVNEIAESTDKIDILVNNAGTASSIYSINETKESWDRVVNLNLTGSFFFTQAIANKFMIPNKEGKIINMASLSALMGLPSAVAYSASKGGILQMTKSLACEWARFNIQVNCLCPGFVATPLIKENMEDDRWMKYMTMRTPMKRLANPDDIAGSVIFLASSLANYITGTSIVIDGGFSSGS